MSNQIEEINQILRQYRHNLRNNTSHESAYFYLTEIERWQKALAQAVEIERVFENLDRKKAAMERK